MVYVSNGIRFEHASIREVQSLKRFSQEKVLDGNNTIKNTQKRDQFGILTGRVLIITQQQVAHYRLHESTSV